LRQLGVFTGKQTASEKKIWNAVPETANNQIQRKMTNGNSIIYECLSHVDFLSFLRKDRPGQKREAHLGSVCPSISHYI